MPKTLEGPSKEAKREFRKVMKTLMEESDRGAVLVGAAFVEEALGDAISAGIRSEGPRAAAAKAALLSRGGPLASAWARKQFALATGVIDDDLDDALELIRRLRNQFAHSHTAVTFAHKDAWAAVKKLERLARQWTSASEREQVLKLLPARSKQGRRLRGHALFASAVAYIVGYLQGVAHAQHEAG